MSITKGSYYQNGRYLASKMEELYSDHDSTGYTHEVENVIQMRKLEWKEDLASTTIVSVWIWDALPVIG